MLAKAAFPGLFLTLAGFVLFLLITLSTPIIKSIYFVAIRQNGLDAMRLGTFGGCSYAGNNVGGLCISPRVGYLLSFSFLGNNGNSVALGLGNDLGGLTNNADSIVWRAFTGALIMNAIAAGFAGISLLLALLAFCCSSRAAEIITFITLLLSSLCGFVAFWIDLAFVLVTRNRINNDSNGLYTGHIGNAFWMALGGMIALVLALCFTGCGMFGRYKEKRRDRRASSFDREQKFVPQQRRHFWQRRRAEPAPVMHQTTASTYPETAPYGTTAAPYGNTTAPYGTTAATTAAPARY